MFLSEANSILGPAKKVATKSLMNSLVSASSWPWNTNSTKGEDILPLIIIPMLLNFPFINLSMSSRLSTMESEACDSLESRCNMFASSSFSVSRTSSILVERSSGIKKVIKRK